MDKPTALSGSARHADFTINRFFDAPVARAFRAWSDPAAKAVWFIGPPGLWALERRELNFEVGGQETLIGRLSSGLTTRYDAHYRDILHGQRIVFVYDMHLDDRHISVSLATVTFSPEGTGTRMIYTEQMVLLDGYEDNGNRKRGTEDHFHRLAASLEQPAVN